MKILLARCPEVESFNFLTQDSGSGFCWVPALYPGINGPSDCKDRPMEQRVSGFLVNLQQAAREAGHEIVINLTPIAPRQWMIPSFPRRSRRPLSSRCLAASRCRPRGSRRPAVRVRRRRWGHGWCVLSGDRNPGADL